MQKQLEEKSQLILRLTEAGKINSGPEQLVIENEKLKKTLKSHEQDISSILKDNSLAIYRIQKREAQQRSLIQDEKNHLLYEKEHLNILLTEAITALNEGNTKMVIPKDTKEKINMLTKKIKEHLENDKNQPKSHVEDLEEENKKLKLVIGDAKTKIDSKEQDILHLRNELESKDLIINRLNNSKKENSENKTDSNASSEDEENTLTSQPTGENWKEQANTLRTSLKEQDTELQNLRRFKERVQKTSQETSLGIPFLNT